MGGAHEAFEAWVTRGERAATETPGSSGGQPGQNDGHLDSMTERSNHNKRNARGREFNLFLICL